MVVGVVQTRKIHQRHKAPKVIRRRAVVTRMILAIDQDEVGGALVGPVLRAGVMMAIKLPRTEREAVAAKVDRVVRVRKAKVHRTMAVLVAVSNPVAVAVAAPARPVDLMVRETLPQTSSETLFQSCHAIT